MTVTDLDDLPFDNRFVAELPGDPERRNVPRQVPAAYSHVDPTPVPNPQLLAVAPEVLDLLDLDRALVGSADLPLVLSGNRVPRGAVPFAMNYGGHQFGTWAGQLGDGRAIALGEVVDRDGGHQTLQLKGAGMTPYAGQADGRAVLRSSIREFLCSEAMFHLGVPTTRALSLVSTGEAVLRDVMYDGNPGPEPGAIVCRVAPSFVRFGTFELPASRGDVDLLRKLVEVTMRNHFPGIGSIAEWFFEVCDRAATLVVHWMRVGFVHGVLNTDNMSILGLTIDYGPYGWLESFDPSWTPNTTDAGTRRYRYAAQPEVVHWNLLQLAHAVVPLTGEAEPLQEALDHYGSAYHARFRSMMAARLGWGEHRAGDERAYSALFDVLTRVETDQVLFFRDLARVPTTLDATDEELLAPLADAWYEPDQVQGTTREAIVAWLRQWARRAVGSGLPDVERAATMNASNPRFVLRNYLAQEVIDAVSVGEVAAVDEMLDVLRHPYDEQPGRERFAAKRPEWARHRVGCSMLSCSS